MKKHVYYAIAVLFLVAFVTSFNYGCGGGGGSDSGSSVTTTPSAPTGVTATTGGGQVTIRWTAVSGATSYNIYWSTTSGVTKASGTKITGATSPYTHASLTNGTIYYYIVTAANSSGESTESTQVSATPVGTQAGTAFPIANTSGREISIGTAFDGTNFMVGIQGDATSDQSVTAQFVSKTGTLVGSRISAGTTGSVPAVAFDGTNYLLAWQEDADTSTYLAGIFVNTSRTLVGTQFTIATGTNIKNHFVIFDGSNYFVAWEDRMSDAWGTSDLFGQFITTSGTKIGSVVSISTAVYGQREFSIAFDGANILVVWVDGRNLSAHYTDGTGTHYYESDVYGQFITKSGASAAGTLSGSNFLINAGTLPRDNPTGIGFDGTNYLVTFIEQTVFNGPIWEAYGILVTKAGATIGSKFVIGNTATNHKMFPAPAYFGTKYLVTWTDGFGTTSASMKGIYITTSGTVEGSEFTLFSPSPTGAVPWAGGVGTGGGVNLAILNWGIPNATAPYNLDLYTGADVMGSIITPDTAAVVTGTVTYSGSLGTVSASKPIILLLNPFPDVFDGFVANGTTYQMVTLTASPSTFTFTNVPAGQYHLAAIFDFNSDGITTGDPCEIYTPGNEDGSNYHLDQTTAFTITAGQTYSLSPNITFTDAMKVND